MMNRTTKFMVLLVTITLSVSTSTAFSLGGGGGIGGAIDDAAGSVGDAVESAGETIEQNRDEFRDAAESAGRITGKAIEDGAEAVQETGEEAYQEATDEQAQQFYENSMERADEFGSEVVKEATDEHAQEFYSNVVEDSKQLGEEGYEAVTSKEAQEFYNGVVEGTEYATKETYSELTDKEAKRFYRNAVQKAEELGVESWERLNSDEMQRIYSSAFDSVQDAGDAVERFAESDEAREIARDVQTITHDFGEMTESRANRLIEQIDSQTSFKQLINTDYIDEERAKRLYQKAKEISSEYGDELTDEEAKELYSRIMKEAEFSAELGKVFGSNMVDEIEDEEDVDFFRGGVDYLEKQYLDGAVNEKEARRAQEFMKEVVNEESDLAKQLTEAQKADFLNKIVDEAKNSESLSNVESFVESKVEEIKWEDMDAEVKQSLELGEARELVEKASEWEEPKEVASNVVPDSLGQEETERFREYLTRLEDYSSDFSPEEANQLYKDAEEFAKSGEKPQGPTAQFYKSPGLVEKILDIF
ncbi:MAG: hypothetical protein H8Z69_04525 [Nanohaloarchaea archaeon]|nr:hypothetical protein [Candidatus Nanohaloarchaea archaeon]